MKKNITMDTLAIFIGCSLVAAGLDMFAFPNDISPGGVSGLAAALSRLIPVSVGTLAFLINLPLLVVAWRVLGFRQLSRTIIATVLLSVLIDLVARFFPVYSGNILLAAALGGVLTGVGIGLLFLRGISTGGTDLLSILLLRVMPNLPIGGLLLCIDSCVVVVAVLVFRDVEVALYSAVMIFVTSRVIDSIMDGANYAKVIYVITDHGDAITQALSTQTGRGVTVFPARGGYTGKDKTVVLTVTRRNTLAQTLSVIKQTDPESFSFVVNAAEVHGEGFRRYRADIGNS
ncbi:MAG: YitT family protein [Oscillospiraceae bacterium]|nr:YitT family protein [Oscillospiraceae bacterium]